MSQIQKLKTISVHSLAAALAMLDTNSTEIEVNGYRVKVNNPRYRLIRSNNRCVYCDCAGTKMLLQTNAFERRAGSAFFHLYTDKCGRMLTIDHIMPKARGGTNKDYNYQLMCDSCQQLKADSYPTTSRFENRHNLYTTKEKQEEAWLARMFPRRK